MLSFVRYTGAWVGLLSDWLETRHAVPPALQAVVARWREADSVPVAVWNELLARAAALCPQDPAPGLAIGDGVQPRHVGVMGYVALASPTLGDALQAYQRYERLFYGASLAEVAVTADTLEIRWPQGLPTFSLLTDTVGLAALTAFLRRHAEGAPAALEIRFAQPAPADPAARAAYAGHFGCPVRFDAGHTALVLPATSLSAAMLRGDPGLRELLDRQARALLQALPDPDALDRALQAVMLRLLPEGAVTLADAACAVSVSARTLQRRLAARGMSWQQLLDRTREQLARQYLADASLSLSEVALLLGFSDQTAFQRAFRQWTGSTPLQARRRLTGG